MRKPSFTIIILVASFFIFGLRLNAQYTKLFEFSDPINGKGPMDSFYSDGTFFYGTTESGGTHNGGTIFKVNQDGSDYMKLHDFAGGFDGHTPRGSLISDGTSLYGMTVGGGSHGAGTIFKIMPDGNGYLVLYNFLNLTTGGSPWSSLIYSNSFLYGMTTYGGSNNFGTIFKVGTDGNGFEKLIDFEGTSNGCWPYGSLFFDGNFLYGMTKAGGINDCGIIFKINIDGTSFSKLLDFDGAITGKEPYGSFIFDGGFLYGVTSSGGENGAGTIFKIMPDGNNFTKLFDFSDTEYGSTSKSTLTPVNGYLYGMTQQGGTYYFGTLYRIKPDGSDFTKLMEFEGETNGQEPCGSLIFENNNFYGTTWRGGTNNNGVLFKYANTTGIDENKRNINIEIYPNPASKMVTVDIQNYNESALTLNIYNESGSIIKTIVVKKNQNQININDLKSGTYLIEINNKKIHGIQKLIIQR